MSTLLAGILRNSYHKRPVQANKSTLYTNVQGFSWLSCFEVRQRHVSLLLLAPPCLARDGRNNALAGFLSAQDDTVPAPAAALPLQTAPLVVQGLVHVFRPLPELEEQTADHDIDAGRSHGCSGRHGVLPPSG